MLPTKDKELHKQLQDKLGKDYTRLKKVWYFMIERCHNKESSNYKWYGAKGIYVCDEWRKSFEAFEKWALENGYTENPRVELDKDIKSWALNEKPIYSPRHCMFITPDKNKNISKMIRWNDLYNVKKIRNKIILTLR